MRLGHDSNSLIKELLRICACEECAIQSILKCAYDFFERPIIVMDMSYNVLGQIPEEEIGEAIWDSQFKHHTTDTSIISDYYKNNMIDAVLHSNEPMLVDWGLVKDCPRIAGAIRNGDEVLGMVGLLCPGGEYEDYDHENLQYVIQALSVVMSREHAQAFHSNIKRGENVLREIMLSILFQGKVQTQKDLDLWETRFNIKFHPHFVILAVVPEAHASSQTYLLANIQQKIAAKCNNAFCTMNDGNLYTLFVSQKLNRCSKITDSVMNIMADIDTYNISYGISNYFSSLLDLESYKYQALKAAQLSTKGDKNLYSHTYEEVVMSDILLNGVKNMPPVCYIHPALEMLKKMDEEQNTCYYDTLAAYINSLLSPKETCEKLFIHRNTLLYRLKRIEELTNMNLSDPKTYLLLMSSLYIEERKIDKTDI